MPHRQTAQQITAKRIKETRKESLIVFRLIRLSSLQLLALRYWA